MSAGPRWVNAPAREKRPKTSGEDFALIVLRLMTVDPKGVRRADRAARAQFQVLRAGRKLAGLCGREAAMSDDDLRTWLRAKAFIGLAMKNGLGDDLRTWLRKGGFMDLAMEKGLIDR